MIFNECMVLWMKQQVDGVLTGIAPVSEMYDYATNVRSYTHGNGTLELEIAGYYPCHNPIDVISQQNYDPVSDFGKYTSIRFLCSWSWIYS